MQGSGNESARVQELVTRLTGEKFELTDVKDYFPGFDSNLHPAWYLACMEVTEANKIPYVNTVWREGNQIRMESLTLGDTSSWIEEDYGEKGVISVLDKNLSDFGNPKVRDDTLAPFPIVKRRIDLQEDVIRRIAQKDHVKLEVRYSGGVGLSTFYLSSIVDASKGDIKSELEAIEKSLKSMKEAWRQVTAL